MRRKLQGILTVNRVNIEKNSQREKREAERIGLEKPREEFQEDEWSSELAATENMRKFNVRKESGFACQDI